MTPKSRSQWVHIRFEHTLCLSCRSLSHWLETGEVPEGLSCSTHRQPFSSPLSLLSLLLLTDVLHHLPHNRLSVGNRRKTPWGNFRLQEKVRTSPYLWSEEWVPQRKCVPTQQKLDEVRECGHFIIVTLLPLIIRLLLLLGGIWRESDGGKRDSISKEKQRKKRQEKIKKNGLKWKS